jgi:hypothetical protein
VGLFLLLDRRPDRSVGVDTVLNGDIKRNMDHLSTINNETRLPEFGPCLRTKVVPTAVASKDI